MLNYKQRQRRELKFLRAKVINSMKKPNTVVQKEEYVAPRNYSSITFEYMKLPNFGLIRIK